MDKNLKIGDKIWIRYGFDYSEAEITDLPNNGALVVYRINFGGGKLSWFSKFLRYYYSTVETVDEFKRRIL